MSYSWCRLHQTNVHPQHGGISNSALLHRATGWMNPCHEKWSVPLGEIKVTGNVHCSRFRDEDYQDSASPVSLLMSSMPKMSLLLGRGIFSAILPGAVLSPGLGSPGGACLADFPEDLRPNESFGSTVHIPKQSLTHASMYKYVFVA